MRVRRPLRKKLPRYEPSGARARALIHCKMISINFSDAAEHNNHLCDPLHHTQSCFMFIEHLFMVHSSCGRYAHAQIHSMLGVRRTQFRINRTPRGFESLTAAHSHTQTPTQFTEQSKLYSSACGVSRRVNLP